MHELQLSLTLDDTNLLLEALGNLPFARVHQLIGRLQRQASAQLHEAETRAATTRSAPAEIGAAR